MIGDWDQGLRLGIENRGLGLVIEHLDWGLSLGIGIGEWDSGLGIGIRDVDRGLR